MFLRFLHVSCHLAVGPQARWRLWRASRRRCGRRCGRRAGAVRRAGRRQQRPADTLWGQRRARRRRMRARRPSGRGWATAAPEGRDGWLADRGWGLAAGYRAGGASYVAASQQRRPLASSECVDEGLKEGLRGSLLRCLLAVCESSAGIGQRWCKRSPCNPRRPAPGCPRQRATRSLARTPATEARSPPATPPPRQAAMRPAQPAMGRGWRRLCGQRSRLRGGAGGLRSGLCRGATGTDGVRACAVQRLCGRAVAAAPAKPAAAWLSNY